MAKVVFILGAGASVKAGVPVMNDFLARARALVSSNNSSISRDDFERVLAARAALRILHATSRVRLENLESLYNLIEMGKIIRRLPGIPDDQIDATATAMENVLAHTIEQSCQFPVDKGFVLPPEPYNKLAEHLAKFGKSGQLPDWAFITFNYDIALDYALHYCGVPPDYGLGSPNPRANIEAGRVKLYKLHGSLNWSRCTCGKLFPIDWNLFVGQARASSVAYLQPTSVLGKAKHCEKPNTGRPGIIPPSWNKTQYASEVAEVWKRAASEISTAEHIVVAGYSLPPTDAFFRDFFRLAVAGQTLIKRVRFINIDGKAADRFKRLLGQESVGRFMLIPGLFEQVLPDLFRDDVWS